MNHKT